MDYDLMAAVAVVVSFLLFAQFSIMDDTPPGPDDDYDVL